MYGHITKDIKLNWNEHVEKSITFFCFKNNKKLIVNDK